MAENPMNPSSPPAHDPHTGRPWTRRAFLKAMSAAAATTLTLGEPRLPANQPVQHPEPTADACIPPQTVAAPHLGSWIARVKGPRNPAIPAFINIGQRLEGVGESEELKAFTTAGFLGSEYGPFNLPYPQDAINAVQPPSGMTP